MENLFEQKGMQNYVRRIQQLSKDSVPIWGKMTVDEMLAHLCVSYEMVYEPHRFSKPGFIKRMLLKRLIKPFVVSEKPYKQNSPTSTEFRKSGKFDFENEKKKLIGFLQKTQQLGAEAFEGKDSISFGELTSQEWNTMFAKHLDHHLIQFGV